MTRTGGSPPDATAGRPLRVAFDMTFPNRNSGGSGVYARAIAAQLRRDPAVEVQELAAAEGKGPAGTVVWLAGGARRAVRASGADLLHCPAYVAPVRVGVPLVLTMHDASPFHYPTDFTAEWRVYSRLFLPLIARSASVILTGTQAMRADVSRHYRLSLRRIVVTPYGVDERYRQPLSEGAIASMREQMGSANPTLLFSGAPLARKNLDLVLQALSNAAGAPLSRARLAISGAAADDFPAYRDKIDALGLRERVTWLGRLPQDDLPLVYAAADVLVYPSFYEGFGFPPLEAMSVGTPVVASNASCLPEVLGDAALLVEPSEVAGFADAL
jgi:glycosyltransferase involved in cell wall biosynthesis